MLLGQMSLWQLESVQEGPKGLKYGQNWANDSWDIANIEFVVELV